MRRFAVTQVRLRAGRERLCGRGQVWLGVEGLGWGRPTLPLWVGARRWRGQAQSAAPAGTSRAAHPQPGTLHMRGMALGCSALEAYRVLWALVGLVLCNGAQHNIQHSGLLALCTECEMDDRMRSCSRGAALFRLRALARPVGTVNQYARQWSRHLAILSGSPAPDISGLVCGGSLPPVCKLDNRLQALHNTACTHTESISFFLSAPSHRRK